LSYQYFCLELCLFPGQKRSQEHSNLSDALAQIRDIITAVDLTVGKYERSQELQEVLARLEAKSFAKLKNGKVFRKQDLHSKHRALHHKGLLYWKTATGRLKDTLALLLTDVLVFLQEKDQRFIFASVDQKPPVIPLQKLIVREVANEERGMFLISASSVGPEMYEVHTTTKEERNSWRHSRQSSLPVTIPLDGYKASRSERGGGNASPQKMFKQKNWLRCKHVVFLSEN
uniref:PH domain-containing protein n=1 Tax=Poecilia mexicana TaxID=48701 RepID=A0A3B3Y5J5_9TELE